MLLAAAVVLEPITNQRVYTAVLVVAVGEIPPTFDFLAVMALLGKATPVVGLLVPALPVVAAAARALLGQTPLVQRREMVELV
jgi:hypothetical protein